MCVNFMHRKEINCNNLHIQFNITYSKYYIVFVTSSFSRCLLQFLFKDLLCNFVQQFVHDFVDNGFSHVYNSSASFISGSARGSNGSGGGDNSAEVGKVNQSEATKTNAKAKSQKTIPIRFSCSAASSARVASARASWVSFSLFFIISWAISRPPFTQTSL
jgi:hypothetical protein